MLKQPPTRPLVNPKAPSAAIYSIGPALSPSVSLKNAKGKIYTICKIWLIRQITQNHNEYNSKSLVA